MNRSLRLRLRPFAGAGLLTFAFVAPSIAAGWQQTPLPFWGAHVREMAIAPSQSGRVYIWTDIGVFRSDDRGAHWTHANAGLPASASVAAIAVSPVDADRVWLLMTYAGHPYGTVARSTNGGASWTIFSEVLPSWVGDIIVLSTNPTVLLAAAGGSDTALVHRSTDEGASWTPVGAGLSFHVYDLESRAADPSIVLAVASAGIARSTDFGSTWTQSGFGGSQVVMSPSDASRVYSWDFRDLLRSTDGGISFTSQSEPFPASGNGAINLVAVHPSIPDQVMVAGAAADGDCNNFYTAALKSTDGGLTWASSYFECPESGPNALLYDPTDANHVYFGLWAGFYHSPFGGAPGTWVRKVDGIANYSVDLVEGDLDGGNYITTGSLDLYHTFSHLYRSLGDLSNWTHVSTTLGASDQFEVNFTNSNFMLDVGSSQEVLGIEVHHLRRSTDGGVLWTTAGGAQGFPDGLEFKGAYSNHGDGARVYAVSSSGTLYRSTNGGENYQTVRAGMQSVTDLVIDPNVMNRVFLSASSAARVQLSTDGGVTFMPRDSGLPAAFPKALFMRRSDHSALMVVFTNGEVWETFNSGLTWSLRFDLDPPTSVTAVDWDEASGHVFCAVPGSGVLSSHPNYDPVGLPAGVVALHWDPAQSTLLAGTSAAGLWQQTISSQVDAPLVVDATAFVLEVAPNPARDATSVRFAVPNGGAQVTADVFDASGRRIRRLVDAALPEGMRQLVWDGAADSGERASAGVYFVRVRAGGEESTARIVRLR